MTEGKEFVTDITVRFRDMDSMGHVNNAVYFTYFEEGRVAFFRKNFSSVSAKIFSFILAHISCDYVKSVTTPGKLSLRMCVTHIGHKSFSLSYTLYDQWDETRIFAKGESIQVHFDYKNKKSVPINEIFRQKLTPYLSEIAP